ncbi:unnamed protein product [Lymnaea stagnalis]|uniref:Uncharacterized protein n=1 Tax=Lymnaea stagnalis TaxID=6523 RepID=A0AAV2HNV0_LYMST
MLAKTLFIVAAVLHIADSISTTATPTATPTSSPTTSPSTSPTASPSLCSNQTELCGQEFRKASATREATFEYYACVRNLKICDANVELLTLKQETLAAIVNQAACKDSAHYATAPAMGQSVLLLVSFLLTAQRLARHITLGN